MNKKKKKFEEPTSLERVQLFNYFIIPHTSFNLIDKTVIAERF